MYVTIRAKWMRPQKPRTSDEVAARFREIRDAEPFDGMLTARVPEPLDPARFRIVNIKKSAVFIDHPQSRADDFNPGILLQKTAAFFNPFRPVNIVRI